MEHSSSLDEIERIRHRGKHKMKYVKGTENRLARKSKWQRKQERIERFRQETASMKNKVFARFGHVCYLCGKPGANTVDHVIPFIKGGTNDIENLRPAHEDCNEKKGKKILVLPVELKEAGW